MGTLQKKIEEQKHENDKNSGNYEMNWNNNLDKYFESIGEDKYTGCPG